MTAYDSWLMSGPGGPHDDTPWCEECGSEYDEDGQCQCEEEEQ